jgi:DNA-binding NarL/FixJ family response regulator
VTIRVLVADDQALVRAGFAGIVNAADGFTVAGEASTGREAVELAHRELPDVVLMDIRMPDMDGIEATRRISSHCPTVRVLILTTFDLDEYVYAALRAGASGFLLKDTLPPDLLTGIRTIAAGEALLAPRVTRRLIHQFTQLPNPTPHQSSPADELRTITEREREVLTLIGEGLTNTEIAHHLHITEGTTKTHITHLLTKLNARDRIQLVITAYRTGLVTAR